MTLSKKTLNELELEGIKLLKSKEKYDIWYNKHLKMINNKKPKDILLEINGIKIFRELLYKESLNCCY